MAVEPYVVALPSKIKLPILISVPHCGTAIPDVERRAFRDEPLARLDDTDWHVEKLYSFHEDIGIPLIYARYSRYVVDLNRPATGEKLYEDGRAETGVMPLKTFAGDPLYKPGQEPDAATRERRLALYYEPYYARVAEILWQLRERFGQVLFYDAHSIRRLVPTIRPTPFPDMILGDQDGKTAASMLSHSALEVLGNGRYQISHNDPFKGGHLTRHWGRPGEGTHALQLEMSQDLYLDDSRNLSEDKCDELQPLLEETLMILGERLQQWA